MTGRDPSEAQIPLDALKRTTFPKLVTSGGHHPAFEAVCDMIERTSTDMAPWNLIAANDKLHARVQVLERLVQAIKRG